MSLALHYPFITSKSLVASVGPTLTCTRALATATRRNSSGIVEAVAANTARFDHDKDGNSLGLLIEEARTNIALHSNDWTDAVYTATNITPLKDATGPDGVGNSASTLTADANDGTITQAITVASAEFTTSVWMKRKTGTGTVEITDNDFTNATDITSDINSLTWTQVGSITRTQANPIVGIRLGTNGDEVEVAYLQTEAGDFSTSPIETAAATVTRNKDDVQSSDVSWYSSTGGALYACYSQPILSLSGYAVQLSDNSASDYAGILAHNVLGRIRGLVLSGGGIQADLVASSVLSAGVLSYQVLSFLDNDFELFYDGTRKATGDQSGVVPVGISALHVGQSWSEASQLNGHIAEIRYYNTRLTNQQLEDMSNGIFPSEGARTGLGLSFGKMGMR